MISSIASSAASAWSNALFSRLDTQNQGYIDEGDLQAAFDQADAGSGTTTDASAVFKQLDTDSDGKVAKDELTTAFSTLAQQLDTQFDQARVQAAYCEGRAPASSAGSNSDGDVRGNAVPQLLKLLQATGTTLSAPA